MTQWEYILRSDVDIGVADSLGIEGWELVGFDKNGDAWFKRPLPVPCQY